MINVVIAAHGEVGAALISAAEMIAGPQEALFSVALLPDDSPESFEEKLAATLGKIEGQETLILLDLFGGTPFNVAVPQIRKPNIECITGVNLPMLLELLMSRDGASLSELADSLVRAGQESVRNLKPLFGKVAG